MNDAHWRDEDEILAYLEGSLDPSERDSCTMHLTECDSCRERMLLQMKFIDEPVDVSATQLEQEALPADGALRFAAVRERLEEEAGPSRRVGAAPSPGLMQRIAEWLDGLTSVPGMVGAVGVAAVVIVMVLARGPEDAVLTGLRGRALDLLPPSIGGELRVPIAGRAETFSTRTSTTGSDQLSLERLGIEIEDYLREAGAPGSASLLLGHLELASGRPDPARQAYEVALKTDLDSSARVEALLGLAAALDRLDLPQRALEILPITEQSGDFGSAVAYNRAVLLLRVGRVDEARTLAAEYSANWGEDSWSAALTERIQEASEDR